MNKTEYFKLVPKYHHHVFTSEGDRRTFLENLKKILDEGDESMGFGVKILLLNLLTSGINMEAAGCYTRK